jgi:hypothetical protein
MDGVVGESDVGAEPGSNRNDAMIIPDRPDFYVAIRLQTCRQAT